MGVTIRPGGASWSYTGFAEFRRALAEEEGVTLGEMAGFAEGGKPWDETRTFLRPLLDHSDDGGYLNAHECEDMLPRLRMLHKKWASADHYDASNLAALIEGMEHCVEHRCAMVFG